MTDLTSDNSHCFIAERHSRSTAQPQNSNGNSFNAKLNSRKTARPQNCTAGQGLAVVQGFGVQEARCIGNVLGTATATAIPAAVLNTVLKTVLKTDFQTVPKTLVFLAPPLLPFCGCAVLRLFSFAFKLLRLPFCGRAVLRLCSAALRQLQLHSTAPRQSVDRVPFAVRNQIRRRQDLGLVRLVPGRRQAQHGTSRGVRSVHRAEYDGGGVA